MLISSPQIEVTAQLNSLPQKLLKVYYNQKGQASEVLMSYELFLMFLSHLPEQEQAYFWTEAWQAKEQAADKANRDGQYKTFSTMNDMITFLDAQ